MMMGNDDEVSGNSIEETIGKEKIRQLENRLREMEIEEIEYKKKAIENEQLKEKLDKKEKENEEQSIKILELQKIQLNIGNQINEVTEINKYKTPTKNEISINQTCKIQFNLCIFSTNLL